MMTANYLMDQVAGAVAFATVGVVSTTQEVAGALLSSVPDADPELVLEESLCLVATATARAMEVGFRDRLEVAASVTPALLSLPYTSRDYVIGMTMIAEGDSTLLEQSEAVYARLSRKQQFYMTHLPGQRFPGPRALQDKMELWMGRVSPPGLPEAPTERLATLDLVALVQAHLRLMLTYAQRMVSAEA
ncbi:MAG: hypothetical protein RhofKO_32780 [Rhodothermales bacterium]